MQYKLSELEPDLYDDIQFHGDGESMECSYKNIFISEFTQDRKTGVFYVVDQGEVTSEVIEKDVLMKCPRFVPFIICDHCGGHGVYEGDDGGAVSCNCEVVVFMNE